MVVNHFLDKRVAMRLDLVTVPTVVTVADGEEASYDHKCPGFKWKMQEHEFQFMWKNTIIRRK